MKKCFFRLMTICLAIVALMVVFFMIHTLSVGGKSFFSDQGTSLVILAGGAVIVLGAIFCAAWCHRKCRRLKHQDMYKHYSKP